MSKKLTKRDNQKFQDILNAGAKVFLEKGYHNANISDVADEVGMLKGSLYYYIDSKDDLLNSIIMPTLEVYIKTLKEILVSNENADMVLEKAIIAHMSPMDIDFAKQAVFTTELPNLSESGRMEARAEIKNYEKLWIQVIKKGMSEKIFRDDIDPKILLYSIFGMTNWTIRWFIPGGRYTGKKLGEIFASFILDGIKIKSSTVEKT